VRGLESFRRRIPRLCGIARGSALSLRSTWFLASVSSVVLQIEGNPPEKIEKGQYEFCIKNTCDMLTDHMENEHHLDVAG
jgi:hypothetical protein